MKKVMKKVTIHELNGVRIIAVDNEAFDWGMEENDFKNISTITTSNPAMKENFIKNIQKHFVESFGEFIGRPTTIQEINKAIETGWIE